MDGEICSKNRNCEAVQLCWLKLFSAVFHRKLGSLTSDFEKLSTFFPLFFQLNVVAKSIECSLGAHVSILNSMLRLKIRTLYYKVQLERIDCNNLTLNVCLGFFCCFANL